jgi:hypothetical protein
VAPDSVGEIRHSVGPVLYVCRERGVGTPDVAGGAPETPVSECHFRVSGAGGPSSANGASMLARPSATAWTPSATYKASSWNCRPWLTFAPLITITQTGQQIAEKAAGQIAVAGTLTSGPPPAVRGRRTLR